MNTYKKYLKVIAFLTAFLPIFSNMSQAQTDSLNLSDFTLAQLLNLEVFTADIKGSSIRETAGVMTLIQHDDIIHSGARDLADVLKLLVPGFEFGVDVEGVVGIGMRGIWAHEGKILLLIDGMECNEDLFSNTLFGNHYQVENIDRIEIVRGPGSAIYGGYAGLGVINIITKTASLNGGYSGVQYSQMSQTFSHRNLNAGFGRKRNNLHFGITAVASAGVRSQHTNIDYYGNGILMKDVTDISSYNMNVHLNYKGFTLRSMIDLYSFEMIDVWGENSFLPITETFDQYSALLQYEWKVSEKLKIVPQLQYKYQTPWNTDIPDLEYACTKTVNKTWGGVSAFWKINRKTDLVSGIEYNNSILGMSNDKEPYEELYKKNQTEINYGNYAFYNQYTYNGIHANITLGMRYDYSTEYGSAFVPRIGFTRVKNSYHLKFMLSQSFRIPGGIIPQRVPDGVSGIVPEKATNYEVEAGLKLGDIAYITLNVFNVVFDKIIIYGRDASSGVGTYMNKGKLGTHGGEVELKQKNDNLTLILNYAYYNATKREAQNFLVPGYDNYFLGFAPHKFNIFADYKLNSKISISAKTSVIGKRFAYSALNDLKVDVLTEYKSQYFVGVFINLNNVLIDKMAFNIGVSNLLDEKELFLQPYKGQHAPLPGLSRALQLRLNYAF